MQSFENGESFELPVMFNGKELMLPASLMQWTYGYRIMVKVDDSEVMFEPDEERQLRAIANDASVNKISMALVRAIGEALEKELR